MRGNGVKMGEGCLVVARRRGRRVAGMAMGHRPSEKLLGRSCLARSNKTPSVALGPAQERLDQSALTSSSADHFGLSL
jgi:hypothetical protein